MTSLIPGDGPEIIASRLAGPRGENRYCRLIHEQTVARLQVLRHPVDDRSEDLLSVLAVSDGGVIELFDGLSDAGLSAGRRRVKPLRGSSALLRPFG